MRTFLTSILVLVFLAGTASAALYTDNFDSYADGSEPRDSANWDALDENQTQWWGGPRDLLIKNPTGSAGEVAYKDLLGWASHSQAGSYYVGAAHAGEPYARVQVDYKIGETDANVQGRVGLNGHPDTSGNYGNQNSYMLTLSASGTHYSMSGISGRLYTTPVSPVADQWYTLILEADYSVGGQVTLTGTIKYTGGAVIGTSTAVDTTLLYSGNYSYIQMNEFGGSQDLRMDNFETEFVPEPATLGVLGIGGILALWRRRRR